MENSMEIAQTNNRTTIESRYFTSSNTSLKRYMHPCVYYSNIYSSKDIETT